MTESFDVTAGCNRGPSQVPASPYVKKFHMRPNVVTKRRCVGIKNISIRYHCME